MSSLVSHEKEISSDAINRGGVPQTVMTEKRRTPQKRLSNETATTASTCGSFRSEVSMDSRPAHIPQSFTSNLSESEIITQLSEELAKLKAESEERLRQASEDAENIHVLAQKLMNENNQLRRESNESKAEINRLEDEVKRLSLQSPSGAATWGRKIQTAKNGIRRSLKIERLSKVLTTELLEEDSPEELPKEDSPEELSEEDASKELPPKKFGLVRQSSLMSGTRRVSIEVPKEGDDDGGGFFSFLQVDKKEKSSSIKVTADALLWDSIFDMTLNPLEEKDEPQEVMEETDNMTLKNKGRRHASSVRSSLSSHQRINAVV
uniref:Uncharacterized protein n=2 Tax=Ditylum brightwellii TaxID=49249 RepID=A0A7S4QV81_9STRA